MVNIFKNKNLASFLPYLIFFSGSFIYFGFFADYIFFYQEKSSLFVFSFDSLSGNLNKPGGLLIYLGQFFTTFYYYPLAGSLILSGILTLIVLSVSTATALLTGKHEKIISFLTGIILFYLQTDYRFLLFNNLGLLLQFVIFLIIIRYSDKLRGWIPIIITPFWYFATGGFSWLLIFSLTLYFAFNKFKNHWLRVCILWAVAFLTVFISGEFLFFQNEKTLWLYPFSEITDGFHQILLLTVAGVIPLLPYFIRYKLQITERFRINETTGSTISACLVTVLLLLTGLLCFDKKNKEYFHVEKLFYQRKFDEIIEYNKQNPPSNTLTIFLNNIALCERNILNDQLFNTLQSPYGNTLFLKWEMVSEILKRGGYFYYSIGLINEAHRWEFENMVMKGLNPEGLKMLIKTELINGNYKVASKYISILKNTLSYRNEARQFENFLFNDIAINIDPELGEKRNNLLNKDFFIIADDPLINLGRLMYLDSLNRNAFEYMVSYLMIKKDYKGILAILPEFEKRGNAAFPVNVEEAIMSLSLFNNGTIPYSGKIQISNNTLARWTQYLTVFQQYGADPKKAEPALKRQFGNTFWYWSFYN